MKILNIEQDGFRQDNTEGYSYDQLDKFNAELDNRLIEDGVECGTDEYNQAVKSFSDEVSRR